MANKLSLTYQISLCIEKLIIKLYMTQKDLIKKIGLPMFDSIKKIYDNCIGDYEQFIDQLTNLEEFF